MFEVTRKAADKIQDVQKNRNYEGVIRLMSVSGGCAGTYLDLFFDEAKDSDVHLNNKNIEFVIDPRLYEQAKPINIDYSTNPVIPGFIVSSALDNADGCGSCACSC